MAQSLVKLAFDASVDKKRTTPYSIDASEAFNMVYEGGKPDDITVLVAQCK
jgi:protein phosphatase PTC7